MTHQSEDVDFIVVGAGPVGMTAAALLSADGARVLVIERNTGTSDEPKAISIDDEALRTYAWAGIADRLLSIIVPGTGTRYYGADGEALFHAGAEIPYRLGFPFKNPFAQPDLERLLLEVLRERPNVEVRFGAQLSEIESTATGDIAVRYESIGGGSTRVAARFLLGADGGRSTVRGLLGIELAGRSHAEDWLVVDALGDEHRERFGMHHGDPRRPHVIVPGLEGRCRYEFRIFDGEGIAGQPPTLSLVREVLAPYRSIESDEVERAVIYRFHGLVATRWREGGAFLLGDAAHMMPPFAGQGLNSGIRDAANLCWKLLAVRAGSAPESILDSYQAERHGHALATVRMSEKLGRVVMTTSPRIAATRDRTIRAALTTAEGREFFEFMRYRPSARFDAGLVLPASDARAGRQIGQPRVFDTHHRDVRLLDDAIGRGWTLLAVTEREPLRHPGIEAFAHARRIALLDVPLSDVLPRTSDGRTALIDVDGGLVDELSSFRGRFLLLRPDHVIAAAWEPGRADSVLDEIRQWWTPHDTSQQPHAAPPAETLTTPHHEREQVTSWNALSA